MRIIARGFLSLLIGGLLSLLILWGGFYLVKDVSLHEVWWGFPYIFTGLVVFVLVIILTIFDFTNRVT